MLLRDIAASPRATGSAAIAAARDRCASELRSLGLEVREQPFTFSAFPGRLGTPLIGAGAAALAGFAGQLGAEGSRYWPLVLLAIGGIALLVAGRWLGGSAVLDTPLLRERGVNMEAVHPGTVPSVWLCAHLDSKSQPVPSLVRVIGIVVESAGLLYTLVLAAAVGLGAQINSSHWALAAFVTLVGAIPVMMSVVGARSPGALDNASGVATIIEAARQLLNEPAAGVLITDGEELGLAGARAWARAWDRERRAAVVLNCDGVDDAGRVVLMYTGTRPAPLLAAVDRASTTTRVAHTTRRMIPGILTDSVAFTTAGLASVTFSRGTMRTLLRVHSRSDDLAHLRGTGIAETAGLMAATAREILQETR